MKKESVMKRMPLQTLLNNYVPSTDELAYKNDILDFITDYQDCFERSLLVGHITASAWLVNATNDKTLLMHHTKLNKWLQLGGHCDGNPDVLAVAIKEAQEESGIDAIEPLHTDIFDIDIHLIPARAHEPEHYHYDIRFLLQVRSDMTVVQNGESKELRWISKNLEELPTQSPSIVRMFHKWVAWQGSKLPSIDVVRSSLLSLQQ
jgi:8-oxo-dGTP pyrophosphatase MutT (NUDIX family)